jgi:hypothetical protein
MDLSTSLAGILSPVLFNVSLDPGLPRFVFVASIASLFPPTIQKDYVHIPCPDMTQSIVREVGTLRFLRSGFMGSGGP